MKTERCHYSGYKIYPGHGKKYVRVDCKAFLFATGKCEKTFLNKTNPRKVKWTQIYRKVHKKGTTAEVHKKRARRVVKVQRDIVGLSREQIKAKREARNEIRASSKEAALKEVKDRQQKRAAKKKTAGGAKSQAGVKVPKRVKGQQTKGR